MSAAVNDELELTQGQVSNVAGARVGVMRIWEDDYELPDGTGRRGLTAKLSVAAPPAEHVVGTGSHLTINDMTYEVVFVDAERLRLARVR